MRRGLQNFTAVFELGRQFSWRLLEQGQISQDCFPLLQELRRMGQSTVLENGQRASALRFGDRRAMALQGALTCQAFIPTEISSRMLRPVVAQLPDGSPDTYSSAPDDL